MKKFLIACCFLLTSLLLLSGCEFNLTSGLSVNTVRGEGDVVTETFEKDGFTAIRVEGAFNVVWREADEFLVNIQMHENLFDHLQINVVNNELRISTNRGFTITRGNTPTITLYSPSIEGVVVSGATSLVNWDVVTTERFSINVAGAASAELNLNVTEINVDVAGAGDLGLYGDISIANISIAGAGNVDVDVRDQLIVNISGAGSVTYYGNPEITRSIAGVGTVRSR